MEEQMDPVSEGTTIQGEEEKMELDEPVLSADDHDAITPKILPEVGDLQIEDFKVYTWKITNWKSLEKRTISPTFEAGGHNWQVLLFPGGNNSSDSVSPYLDFADTKTAGDDWHVCAQFALLMCNSKDPTIYTSSHAYHRFVPEESDWGFTAKFYDLRKLYLPVDGKTRPMVEDDTVTFKAFVRIIKDETGVLWHKFINYDSKKETGYVGLKNQGATCYMNSLLQSLYCTNFLRKSVYQIPTLEDEPSKSVALALQRVFYQLQTSETPVGTTELTKSFGWTSNEAFAQHDVQELNRILQEKLEIKMKGTPVDGALTKLFVGKMKSYIKCVNVDYESSRVEDFYDIQLNVKGNKNLHESFKDYIQEEMLEGENKYMAEGHGLQDAKKGVSFLSFPPVLHLHLKRFEYDMMRDDTIKINDRLEFPMSIDLEEFVDESADRSQPHVYDLYGVLVHSGDLHGGHYFGLIKPSADGKWLKFDDDRVTPVTDKDVLEENFGGDYLQANGAPLGRTFQRSIKRFTNAYMLVYIRRCAIPEVMPSVSADDVPAHLRKRLEDERLLLEARRKEREEQHLYLNIKVITEDTFKAHQSFDLAAMDDKATGSILTYRVLKEETLGAFKNRIVSELGVPADKFRFWVLVNRQNKTIRPENPVAEADLNVGVEIIRDKMASRASDLKLYVEIAGKDSTDRPWSTLAGSSLCMIFLKHFDATKQTLTGVRSLHVQKQAKVMDIIPTINETMGWPANTALRLYEEIKPTMIEIMKPRQTFSQSEIQDGDIICFQKDLTDKETEELVGAGRIGDAVQYYDHLLNRIGVQFKAKGKDRDAPIDFELVLNKKMSYEQMAQRVGEHLQIDPMKIRFTTSHHQTGMYRNVVKRTANQTLYEMLQPSYLQPISTLLYYEPLDVSIVELETKRMLKVVWISHGVTQEELVDILVPKNSTIAQVIDILRSKVTLSEGGSGHMRIFDVSTHKIQRQLEDTMSIQQVTDFANLYAEEIPKEEVEKAVEDKVISAFHFSKEPVRAHGIPFKFVIKPGEKLPETKVRLQARTGIPDKDWAKVRFALVVQNPYAKANYLEDDDVIYDHNFADDDQLGLDHIDKSGKGRYGNAEKALFIK